VNDISGSRIAEGVQTGSARPKFFALTRPYTMLTSVATGPVFFDIETDALPHVTRIHCLAVSAWDSDLIKAFGPDQIEVGLAHLREARCICGHGIAGFDLVHLQRLCGDNCFIRDTSVVRQLLPNIRALDVQAMRLGDPPLDPALVGRHSLAAWGARPGFAKVGADITDFSKWAPGLQERCIADVGISKRLWKFLQPETLAA
jgi:hypothetical protein